MIKTQGIFFDPSDVNDDTELDSFCKKSSWVPAPNREAALETYTSAVDRDITKDLPPTASHYDNLTKEERWAVGSLMTRTNIVIKKADKGSSARVIMSREDYIPKVRGHLNNRDQETYSIPCELTSFNRDGKPLLHTRRIN